MECIARNCNKAVPQALAPDRLCITHLILTVEEFCSDMRRSTAGVMTAEQRTDLSARIGHFAERLIQVATGGDRIQHELKMRILNAMLALMNLRESMERPASKAAGQ
jgi:hypothetical protein